MESKIKNALSVDVEDWFQGVIQISYHDWPRFENRLSRNLKTLLELFNKYKARATFFVLGYVADQFPELVKLIADHGHEVASHGYYHRPIFEQSPEEFRQDISRSKKAIESIIGVKVKGYRAPVFTITKKTFWALSVLEELGFKYDSSVFPTKNFMYGIPDAPRSIYRVEGTNLIEFPLSVVKKGRLNIPVCGGFYLRMLPYAFIKWGINSFNRSFGPAVVYLHPWEIDSQRPKLELPLPFKWKVIYQGNIKTMYRKIEQLLKDFEFRSISEVIAQNQPLIKGA